MSDSPPSDWKYFVPTPASEAHGGAEAESLADDLHMAGGRDLDALHRIYVKTYGKLLAICMKITRDRDHAEDVLHEVYIKVWNNAGAYDRSRSPPLAWLATLARNSAIDWYRAQARRSITGLAEVDGLRDDSQPIDEELIDREQHERAATLVGRLNEDQRNHIRDIFFEGLSYADLADRDGVPVGTIKSRIHRAIHSLAKQWDRD